MKPTSTITIDSEALASNFRFLRELFGQEPIISSVVKGNAYGHGIEQFVPLAEKCGQKHFSVYSADEAWRVMKFSNNQPTIMIMGSMDSEQVEWAVANEVEFFVFDLKRLNDAITASQKTGKRAIIHLEAETGMNRTGLTKSELLQVATMLQLHSDRVYLKGICTHFAGAESIANFVRIRQQKVEYRRILKWFSKRGFIPEQRHTCCSAAAVRHPEMRYDMVRIGIMQYGLWPSEEVFIDFFRGNPESLHPLKRLISWKSRVMSVKKVKTGEFIGYGTSFLAPKNMKIAILPIGYAHGFSRSLSNQGHVLIRGKRAAVVGTVNMNCLAVDVSGHESVESGDEVVLIGKQGDQEVTVASFGELSNQMNYELLTRLPQDIPRLVV